MSTLTQNERDGLDEVFLSIQANRDKYRKIKDISALIVSQQHALNFSSLFKQAKYGLKKTKLSRFLLHLSKKKKNLSK